MIYGSAQSCSMAEYCRYSVELAGEAGTRCHGCRLSPTYADIDISLPSYWKPLDRKMKHPVIEAAKRKAARDRQSARDEVRRNKSRARQKILQQADRAEKTTERKLIKATKNSGRSNRDGDHVAAGRITLDTKLQTKRINPVVNMTELHKVKMDARAGGNPFGALVLRTKLGAGVVVMYEKDFARLVQQLVESENNDTGTSESGPS